MIDRPGEPRHRTGRREFSLAFPAAIVLVAIVWFVFRPALDHALLSSWDDQLHLTQNAELQPGEPNRYTFFWTTPYAKLYVPITYNAWAWLYARSFDGHGTLDPRLLHAANLVAHAFATTGVFVLLATLLRPRSESDHRAAIPVAAALGAALFALHPLQVEAVAWISELRGLLAADFALLAMLAHVIESRRRGIRYSLAILTPLLLAAGCLCKPNVAAVPLMMFVIDRFWLGRSTRRTLLSLVPCLAVSAATLVLMRMLQGDGVVAHVALWRRPFVACDALAFYLGRICWPFDLTADYSRTPALAAMSAWFWIAPVVAIALGVALWRWRSPVLWTAVGLFAAALLPVLGLVPFDFQRISTVADRYAYLAMLGPVFALAWVVARQRSIAHAAASAGILLALLGWRSVDQLQSWRDAHTLWTHAIEVNPHAVVALCNLGDERATAGDVEAAAREFQRALMIDPRRDAAHFGMADLAIKRGDRTTALGWYDRAAAANADDADALARANTGAASMLVELNRLDEAEQRYRAAIAASPTDANAWSDLGALLLDRGRPREAIDAFDRALAARPRHPLALLNLATAYERLGDSAAADAALHRAVERLPREPLPRWRLGNRAFAAGDVAGAIAWDRQAVALSPAEDALLLNDLARALATHGDLDEAIATFARAVALRPDLAYIRQNLEAARRVRAATTTSTQP